MLIYDDTPLRFRQLVDISIFSDTPLTFDMITQLPIRCRLLYDYFRCLFRFSPLMIRR